MSDISELRLRVDAAEERFESVGDQQRQYGARLLSLMNAVEGGLSRKQAALEECTAELERVTAENEQLRGMLQSLLQAVESNGEDQLDDTMNSLDAMVTALTGGAAGAVEAQPEETAASGSEAVLVEDDEEVDTNLAEIREAETGEPETGEEAPAEALVAAEAQENPVEDAAPLEEADTAEVEPETATEVEAAEDQAEELEVAAEAPEPETSEVDAADGVADADTAEAGGGDLEPEETASEIPAAEADEVTAEASEDSAPQEAQEPEPQETVAEEPEPTASRSPVGDIIARISEKTKDFPSEEVVMDSLAKIEAGVLASEGETPTLDSEFDEADYIDPTAAAAS